MRYAIFLCAALAMNALAQPTTQDAQRELIRQHMARIHSCYSNSDKCRTVCERANELEGAAESLMHCAANHDYEDDCSSRAHSARDAANEYEEAVSEAGGDCH
jgi:hypothetical protein